MQTDHPELIAGALDNLMRYLLNDCPNAAGRAALLLERLAEEPDGDAVRQAACQRLSEKLAGR